ncbi:hypothetical protein B0T11DRAFT_114831 [Plectosphaerella cucumerina]|uniref:Uncharacterized protein n=1 Tax=Plectosphaerella cucumerina TaxID=40658 RepID=A0A8K0TEF3_9PEZI|nr:hypothetical protein B0T11DRAFT_114831 [Plectosphaerella cucumerina]
MHCNRFFALLALVASVTAAPQGIVVVPIEITNCTILEAPVAQAAAILEGFRAALQGTAVGAEIASLTQGYYDGYGAMLYACNQVFELAAGTV